jgi:hypothetical protein
MARVRACLQPLCMSVNVRNTALLAIACIGIRSANMSGTFSVHISAPPGLSPSLPSSPLRFSLSLPLLFVCVAVYLCVHVCVSMCFSIHRLIYVKAPPHTPTLSCSICLRCVHKMVLGITGRLSAHAACRGGGSGFLHGLPKEWRAGALPKQAPRRSTLETFCCLGGMPGNSRLRDTLLRLQLQPITQAYLIVIHVFRFRD